MEKFGESLAKLRQDQKMTQRELAGMLHVSIGTISNYEKATHLPSLENLLSLAELFHVTTDYLLGRCEYNLSPDVFHDAVTDDTTVGDFVQELLRLPPDRRNILLKIVDDMGFRALINRYRESKCQ